MIDLSLEGLVGVLVLRRRYKECLGANKCGGFRIQHKHSNLWIIKARQRIHLILEYKQLCEYMHHRRFLVIDFHFFAETLILRVSLKG